MKWHIIDSGRLPPKAIMAKDQELLTNLADDVRPVLHLYEWTGDCLTYGHFTDPFRYLDASALQTHQIQIARRPTGGGIIFHLTDFAFSALVPASHSAFSFNTLENYAFINHLVIQVIAHLFSEPVNLELLSQETVCLEKDCYPFCMAKPTQYDVMLKGKKVGGAAQRRTKWGFLHQGSISLALPPLSLLKEVLKQESKVLEAMQQYSYTFLPPAWTAQQLREIRQEIKECFSLFIKSFD